MLVKPGLSPSPGDLDRGAWGDPSECNGHLRLGCKKTTCRFVRPREMTACFTKAIGAALVAAENRRKPPVLEELIAPAKEASLEWFAGLSQSLNKVRRMKGKPFAAVDEATGGCARFRYRIDRIQDGGVECPHTGAALARVHADRRIACHGGAIAAATVRGRARRKMSDPQSGSDRQRARDRGIDDGKLLRQGIGFLSSMKLPRMPKGLCITTAGWTRFSRLAGRTPNISGWRRGRVVDCAMNEACSAGTGSFIEEQGKKFGRQFQDVAQLGREALNAERGISLGQHCSVFMAEVIDQASAAGVDSRSIIAGLYDSVIQNYLFRVKGSRSVGDVVFCQGMPFASDALAAAVARLTGSEVVVPPDPGTVGALGIALLASREGRRCQALGSPSVS